MADGTSIRIEGLQELDDILRNELPRRAGRNALSASLSAGSQVVVKRAKQLVPKDTGDLKRNIIKFKVKAADTGFSMAYGVGVRLKGKRDEAAYYWWMVENGTSKTPAQPYLRPAFDGQKEAAATVIRDTLLRKVIGEAVKAVG